MGRQGLKELIDELENKCGFWQISRNIREMELKVEETKEATTRYNEIGCYDCDGHNKRCPVYFNPRDSYLTGIRSGSTDKKNKDEIHGT